MYRVRGSPSPEKFSRVRCETRKIDRHARSLSMRAPHSRKSEGKSFPARGRSRLAGASRAFRLLRCRLLSVARNARNAAYAHAISCAVARVFSKALNSSRLYLYATWRPRGVAFSLLSRVRSRDDTEMRVAELALHRREKCLKNSVRRARQSLLCNFQSLSFNLLFNGPCVRNF